MFIAEASFAVTLDSAVSDASYRGRDFTIRKELPHRLSRAEPAGGVNDRYDPELRDFLRRYGARKGSV